MSDLRRIYSINENLAIKGVWVTLLGGVRVKLVYFGKHNKGLINFLTELNSQGILENVRNKQVGDDEVAFMKEAIAKYCIIDWKNVELDGKPITFHPNMALQMFKEFDDFYLEVYQACTNRTNFQKKDKKKSPKDS